MSRKQLTPEEFREIIEAISKAYEAAGKPIKKVEVTDGEGGLVEVPLKSDELN